MATIIVHCPRCQSDCVCRHGKGAVSVPCWRVF
ncbi:hypothetical protein APX81_25980 [Escherichia coli]|nr:hypothetical protein [Shigella boydii]EAC1404529.1 hypothetical protein [Escherichia coli]EFV8087263.1 hypothetical protein [Shigella dysenteriae]EFX5373258.1 hypothetical protein [Shigella flexneri]EFY6543648.1 hypothetical protein [Shigella sonnei]EGR6845137.1 hypothetical protein [Salmonella enterica]QQT84875.1 hypothetical protein I6I95_25590 [Serratia plymuthica]